jgi:hypothetical protein
MKSVQVERSDDNEAEIVAGSAIAVLPTPPRIDLKTIDDVRVEAARVYRDMRAGRIEPAIGTRLVYVLSVLGKLIEAGEIEKRLEAVEGVLRLRKSSR